MDELKVRDDQQEFQKWTFHSVASDHRCRSHISRYTREGEPEHHVNLLICQLAGREGHDIPHVNPDSTVCQQPAYLKFSTSIRSLPV